MLINPNLAIFKKLFGIIFPYATTITISGESFLKLLNSSSLFKFEGFLKFILFFLQNSSTADELTFCPRFDFFGG